MKAVHGFLEVFGVNVHLAWDARSWAAVRRKLPSGLETWKEAPGVATTYDERPKDGSHHIAIRFNLAGCPGEAEFVGMVAHESLHAALSVCDRTSINIDIHNDEPAAYIAQWFAAFIWMNRPEKVPWAS